MTDDEIKNVLIGRETDALMEANIMGSAASDLGGIFPHYTTDLAAALLVIDHLRHRLPGGVPNVYLAMALSGGWGAGFGNEAMVYGETLPLAICRAALMAAEHNGVAQ